MRGGKRENSGRQKLENAKSKSFTVRITNQTAEEIKLLRETGIVLSEEFASLVHDIAKEIREYEAFLAANSEKQKSEPEK